MDNNIGSRIRLVRKAMGLTQAQLAKLIGLTSNLSIYHYEKGLRKPSGVIIRALAQISGKEESWFIDNKNLQQKSSILPTLCCCSIRHYLSNHFVILKINKKCKIHKPPRSGKEQACQGK